MFVALDSNGNRVYADSASKEIKCFCPACQEPLKLRKGSIKKPHFAHLPETECSFGQDKDYKTEWHIRMQEYFPRESREVRFVDNETGEVHISDVFLANSNTVLEFQHSPISEEEFKSRTLFHLKNGPRLVWLFDESSQGEEANLGRFKYDDLYNRNGMMFYKWLRQPRQFLKNVPNIQRCYNYSVCVYTGTEGDVFRRIVDQECDFKYVAFSLKRIVFRSDMDIEQFFEYDEYWKKEDINIQRNRQYAEAMRLQSIAENYYWLTRKKRKTRF